LFEHLALVAQRAHLAAQVAYRLAFIRCQGVAHTIVARGVPHPVPERLVRDPDVLGEAGQGAVAAANEANRLSLELRRIGWLAAGHGTTSSWASPAQ
jgi:hypothetical protein